MHTCRRMKPRPPEEEHLHLLGPPIKVQVGDIAEVYFRNKASRPYSIFPHGVAMEKPMEGSVYYLRNSGECRHGIANNVHILKYVYCVFTFL